MTRRYEMGRLVDGTLPPAPAVLKLDSTVDLRSFLLRQMQAVVNGDLSADQVKSICNLSEQVYKTAKLEIEFAQTIGKVQSLRLTGDGSSSE